MTVVDPLYGKVALLMNMNTDGFPVDRSPAGVYLSSRGGVLDKPVFWSGGFMKFSGATGNTTSAALRIRTPIILTGDFSIELDCQFGADNTGNKTLFETVTPLGAGGIRMQHNTTFLDFTTGGTWVSRYNVPGTGQTFTVELTRAAGKVQGFVNGFQRGTTWPYDASLWTDPVDLTDALIGNAQTLNEVWTGGIRGVRITNGAFRHNADFTGGIIFAPYPLSYASLTGHVLDDVGAAAPAGWRVAAYRRDTGALVGTALTVAGGGFTLPCATDQEVTVCCFNAAGTLIDDQVIRVLPG
jgi:hypothetical protein